MKAILTFILNIVTSKMNTAISDIAKLLTSWIDYKKENIKQKANELKKKENEQFAKKTDDVIKNGSLEDLLNLKKK